MLSSLTQLKAFLLPPTMRTRTDFDAQITGFGLGVKAMMEQYCNRRFERIADVYKTSARNLVFSLPRFPVEAVARVTLQTVYVATDITDVMRRDDLVNGLIYYASTPGTLHAAVVIEYTGGFWYDTSEDQSGVMPDGATALPADLIAAFNLQMKAVCEAQDLFGLAAAGDAKMKVSKSLELDFIPAVRGILNSYRRFA